MSCKNEDVDKKPEENTVSTQDVHSANSWETADLGDKQRNEKFLRLMGASKKEHHGKFVIGDCNSAHGRLKSDEEHLAEDLAAQYEQSLEHRLAGGYKGHLGLGFHPPDVTRDTDEKDNVKPESGSKEEERISVPQDDKNESRDKGDEKSEEKDERKRKISEDEKESLQNNPHSESKQLKFVKSSS